MVSVIIFDDGRRFILACRMNQQILAFPRKQNIFRQTAVFIGQLKDGIFVGLEIQRLLLV